MWLSAFGFLVTLTPREARQRGYRTKAAAMRSNCSPMPCSVSQCVGHTATRTAPAFRNASICSRVVSGG